MVNILFVSCSWIPTSAHVIAFVILSFFGFSLSEDLLFPVNDMYKSGVLIFRISGSFSLHN